MISTDQIRNYPLFAKLSDAELESVAARLVKHSFAKGAYIYYPHNPGLNTYLVESGLARVFFCNARGQEFLLSLARPRSVIGLPLLLDDQARMAGAAALTPTVVLALPQQDVFHFMRSSPQFNHNLFVEMSATLRKLMLHYQSMVTISLKGRLAVVVLFMAGESRKEFELLVSQAEFASWLGASRGRLNRAWIELVRAGLIRVDGQKVSILDRQGLEILTEGLIPPGL